MKYILRAALPLLVITGVAFGQCGKVAWNPLAVRGIDSSGKVLRGALDCIGNPGAGTGDMLASNNLSDVSDLATARLNLGLTIGTNVQAFDADLAALAALASTGGMLSRTGAGTFAVRTLAGTTNRISVTNGDGVSGAPTFNIGSLVVQTDQANTFGAFLQDFGSALLKIPNSTTLPATCAVGQAYMDTDATSGQRFYLCESTNTWALQGGVGGGGVTSVGGLTGVIGVASGIAVSGSNLVFDSSVLAGAFVANAGSNAILAGTGNTCTPSGTTGCLVLVGAARPSAPVAGTLNVSLAGAFEWYDGSGWHVAGSSTSPLTTKGDLYGFSSVDARIPVGTNGQVLTADSTQTPGVKWATVSGTGDVVGPSSATDNCFSRFDSTTGKLIQNSVVCADDSGNTTVPGSLSLGASPPSLTVGTGFAMAWLEGTNPSVGPASGVDVVVANSSSHALLASFNNGTYSQIARFLDFASPPAIGNTAPAAIHGTTIDATTSISVIPDGVHAGLAAITGNTTLPTSLPSNSAGFIGPNSASFTSYFMQMSDTAPAANNVLLVGAPSSNVAQLTYGKIASANLNITTTTCTNQFLTAISATGIGTCTPDTLAGAQHANQGTTTTVLHGNGSGNPSFGQIVAADIANNTITGTQIASSIALAGSPTTTTQSADDNSTKMATTAYVDRMKTRGIGFSIGDPAGSALSTGVTYTAYVTVPYACTISAYNLAVDAGTITVKFLKAATGTAIPTVGSNSISTSGVSISSGTAIHSSTVSDFTTTAVSANDIMGMQITAASTAKFVNGVLQCDQ